MNISKLITFIFRNITIFWDISKWNRRQTNWDGEYNVSIIWFSFVSYLEKICSYSIGHYNLPSINLLI